MRKNNSQWKLLANLAETSTIAFQRATKFIVVYHSAPCLVIPPCRAKIVNPNRVVQRSMESMFVPRFSGHLIGIAPVYEFCHLFHKLLPPVLQIRINRVHAKGVVLLRKGVFLPSKHLLSAFYNSPPLLRTLLRTLVPTEILTRCLLRTLLRRRFL